MNENIILTNNKYTQDRISSSEKVYIHNDKPLELNSDEVTIYNENANNVNYVNNKSFLNKDNFIINNFINEDLNNNTFIINASLNTDDNNLLKNNITVDWLNNSIIYNDSLSKQNNVTTDKDLNNSYKESINNQFYDNSFSKESMHNKSNNINLNNVKLNNNFSNITFSFDTKKEKDNLFSLDNKSFILNDNRSAFTLKDINLINNSSTKVCSITENC